MGLITQADNLRKNNKAPDVHPGLREFDACARIADQAASSNSPVLPAQRSLR